VVADGDRGAHDHPAAGATPTKPGSATFPLPGIISDIVDETGHSVGKAKGGILVIKRPWPSMLRTIWGDPERYRKTYWPEDFKGQYYLAGDGASYDEDGYIRIMGRIDDVLNVSGHRLGTMEIESALVANPKVAEAAVVGRPDDLTGEAICAFVVLKQARPGSDEALKIVKELQDWVGKEIRRPSPSPRTSAFGDNLPKTRSGRSCGDCSLLHSEGRGDQAGRLDPENPAILQQLSEKPLAR
jgi:acetyl-CoA synthetase